MKYLAGLSAVGFSVVWAMLSLDIIWLFGGVK